MGYTARTEPQCLYKGDLYHYFTRLHDLVTQEKKISLVTVITTFIITITVCMKWMCIHFYKHGHPSLLTDYSFIAGRIPVT